jgi:Nucleotidyl transferase AbiEii toxin, Type IV TA system
LVGRRIKEDADYQGVRLTLVAFLEKARIPMQIDIGFGDVVSPEAEERDYPTLLDLPAAHLRMYPRETVIAEKFEAMVDLGTLNTRMKDFFDIWLLASQFNFTGPELAQAIEKTPARGARVSRPPDKRSEDRLHQRALSFSEGTAGSGRLP